MNLQAVLKVLLVVQCTIHVVLSPYAKEEEESFDCKQFATFCTTVRTWRGHTQDHHLRGLHPHSPPSPTRTGQPPAQRRSSGARPPARLHTVLMGTTLLPGPAKCPSPLLHQLLTSGHLGGAPVHSELGALR